MEYLYRVMGLREGAWGLVYRRRGSISQNSHGGARHNGPLIYQLADSARQAAETTRSKGQYEAVRIEYTETDWKVLDDAGDP